MASKAGAAAATRRPLPTPKIKGFDMSQIVKFPADFYDMGVVKFAAGQYYPLNSETQSLVNTGYAELVNPDDGADPAEVLQALAQIAIERAIAAREQANALEDAADKAVHLAELALRGTLAITADSAAQAQAEQKVADKAEADLEAANQATADADKVADTQNQA